MRAHAHAPPPPRARGFLFLSLLLLLTCRALALLLADPAVQLLPPSACSTLGVFAASTSACLLPNALSSRPLPHPHPLILFPHTHTLRHLPTPALISTPALPHLFIFLLPLLQPCLLFARVRLQHEPHLLLLPRVQLGLQPLPLLRFLGLAQRAHVRLLGLRVGLQRALLRLLLLCP